MLQAPSIPSQQAKSRFHIYVDESSQSGAHFMVLGALVIEQGRVEGFDAALQAVRTNHRLDREMKWGKVSKQMLRAYAEFMDVGISGLHKKTPGFYAIVIDATELDHGRYNGGDHEIGFSKFIYQLLVKCARLFGRDGAALDCFLDDRTTRQTLAELRTILNNGANSKFGVRPFRRVEFRDSKESNLIQFVDLMTGAIAYHWNKRHLAQDASPPRIWLANHLAERLHLKSLGASTVGAGQEPFSIWKFQTSPRGAPRRA